MILIYQAPDQISFLTHNVQLCPGHTNPDAPQIGQFNISKYMSNRQLNAYLSKAPAIQLSEPKYC